MKPKENYELVAKVIEELAGKGFTMLDFAQFVRELSERKEFVSNETKDNLTIEQRVTLIMREIGIPANIKGYQYLRFAICEAVNDLTIQDSMCKILYPLVAQKFDTKKSSVERAIRHAIEVAWDRGNPEVIQKYFGYTVNSCKGRPTISEFISLIADSLRCELHL